MAQSEEEKAHFKPTVRRYVDEAQLKEDLAYTTNNLSGAMMKQSSLFAHYGVQFAKASRQTDNLKMALEATESAVYRKVRDELAQAGEKITEALLDKLVARHERTITMKKAVNEAKQIETTAKIATESFRHRRDMLIQEGLLIREEMKGELSIQAKRESSNTLDNLKDSYLKRVSQNSDEEAA